MSKRKHEDMMTMDEFLTKHDRYEEFDRDKALAFCADINEAHKHPPGNPAVAVDLSRPGHPSFCIMLISAATMVPYPYAEARRNSDGVWLDRAVPLGHWA